MPVALPQDALLARTDDVAVALPDLQVRDRGGPTPASASHPPPDLPDRSWFARR